VENLIRRFFMKRKVLAGVFMLSAMTGAFAEEPSVGVGIGNAVAGSVVGTASIPSVVASSIATAIGSAASSVVSATSHNASDSHTTTSHH
jgi:hypothetical protein